MSSVFQSGCSPCGNEPMGADGYLLSPNSKSHNSPIFELGAGGADECALLRVFNLQPGVVVKLEMVTGTGAGQLVGPAVIGGSALQLDKDNTLLHLDQIGRYRVVAYINNVPVEPGEQMPTVELLRDSH